MKLGVVLCFDAAHSLPGYEGKCRRVHGHTYRVEVAIEGEKDPRTQFVMDYFDLEKAVKEVLDGLDHRYLNEIIEHPSCENIALYIREKLEQKLRNVKLVYVKLWEGENKWTMV